MATREVGSVVGAIERVATRASTADELLEAVAAEVGRAVPYDGAMWFGVDPATLLGVAPARMEHLDDGYCQPFWYGEFHSHDANLFVDLARSPVPVATLVTATGGQLQRSPRYRDFLRPQGYVDELRGVFRTGDTPWGVVALLRDQGRDVFDAREVAVLNAVSGVIGTALRRFAAFGSVPASLTTAPGLLLFDGGDRLVSINATAREWLSQVQQGGDPVDWVQAFADPTAPDLDRALPIIPLLARARAVVAGRDGGEARLRLRDRSGRWLLFHASVLEGEGCDGSVAVVVEPAKSADVAPIVIEAYALTGREREVVRAIARGSSTPEIASELFLSAHTVRDYIKSVFDKVGVSSRAELVAKLFAEHYSDPFHATLVHD